MKLLLVRDTFTDISTTGKLYVDGKFECYSLEDVVREQKVFGETAIPYGTYQVILDLSYRFKRILPHILDVPNFDGVRIHIGNSAENTRGCILVGMTRKQDWIGQSQIAFKFLMEKLEEAYDKKESITIEIIKGNSLG